MSPGFDEARIILPITEAGIWHGWLDPSGPITRLSFQISQSCGHTARSCGLPPTRVYHRPPLRPLPYHLNESSSPRLFVRAIAQSPIDATTIELFVRLFLKVTLIIRVTISTCLLGSQMRKPQTL